ncbi:unnamed protein product [Prorocentrum cordatum]|uniref:Uncharacterized protein n=1 Tax=Prorocentrum cordatum TaxID=2364126 RepID=A0ABN9YCW1_9DINO|nr:unnamed protein product [Polarella glacialis]
MQLAEEEAAGAMEPAGEAAATELLPVPAEGETAQDKQQPPAPLGARRLCEGYALAQAMGRKLRAKQESGICVFSTVKPGLRARAPGGHCVFCTPERMKEAAGNPTKQMHVVSALKKFEQEKPAAENQKPEIYQKAMSRLRRHLTVEEFKTIVTPKHCCRGAGADMCIFNTQLPGKPARVKKSDNSLCSWCDPGRLRTMRACGAGGVLTQLEAFRAKDPVVSAKAMAIAKDIFGDDYRAKLQQKRNRANQQGAQHPRRKGEQKEQWAEALQKRQLQMASPHREHEARKRYRADVLADQKKVMNSFFPEEAERRPRGRADEVPKPEDVLPPLKDATHSDLSAGLRSWLERGSWGKCRTCGCLQPRPMHEIDLAGDPKVEIPQRQCRRCNAGRDYWAPCPDDVPKPLRNLSEDIVQALRPIDIDVGPETRSTDSLGRWNGYRKKVKMVTFYFSKWRVVDKINGLEGKDTRSTARKAHRYLMSCDESAYRRFHDMHETFMNKHGEDAEDRKRRRPYHFLQEVGLECALWPQLYWREDMTETHEQWSDVRREENREAKDPKKKRARYGDDSEESACEDGEEDEESGGQRTSVKRSFIAKCMSDLIGYQGNFELLQFVFDLNLWATLGAKKNLNLENVPMRIRMKGHPFSPLYWKDTLNALVDLVRQVGLPKLFFTIAPWEQSFPYHEWLRDEMYKTLKTRMHLPVGETLHITHSLMQIVRGVIAGNNQQSQGRADRRWKKHVFSSKTDDGVANKSVISFTRVEFQDGSRKEGAKRYDGSGRPHLHVLFFADEDALADAKLEQHLFASKSDEFSDHLKGYIDGSQLDKRGESESKWPVYNGEPGYHVQAEKLLLQHSSADKEAGLRAFCVDVMDAVPIHQDWLESDGESLLLQYVTKYVAKFSDSSYDEWMSDQASADSVARRVCFEYHPYEPEMILQLCGAQYRQVDLSTASGGWKSVTAPYAGMQETPAWVKKYESCSWRNEEMCLLDWLRKTNDSGEIAGWLKARHQKAVYDAAYQHHCGTLTPGTEPPSQTAFRTDLRKQYKQSDESAPFVDWMKEISVRAGASVADFPTLEEYARTYTVRGEKIVAVDTVFEFNDRYYGQWAAMNVPFRKLEDLQCEVVQRLVPSKYQHLATALKLCSDRQRVSEEFQDIFVDQAKFMNLMKVAGNSQKFSEAVHRMIVGQRKLIDMYLTGVLNKEDEKGGLDAEAVAMGNRRPRRTLGTISELSLKDATDGVPRALVSAISELSLKGATVGAFAEAFAAAAAAAHARRASGARERYLRAIFEGVPRALVSAISELSLKDATVGAFAVAFAAAAAAAHARRASGARERYLRAIFEGVPRALVSAISELSLKDATVGAFAVAFAPAAAAAHARRASGARERYLRAIFEGVLREPVSAISELSLKDATVGAIAVAFAPAAAAAHARRASGARERYLRAIFEGVPRALVSAISELSLKDATVGAFAVALRPLRPPPTPGVPRALVSAISELSLKDATVGAFAVAFAPAAAAAHARRASGARERYPRAIFEGVPRALVSAISELSLKDATVGAFAVAFAPAAAATHARRASGVPRALVRAISELSLKDATVGAFAVAFAAAAAAAHASVPRALVQRLSRSYLLKELHSVPRALVSAISELSLKDATVGAFAVAFAPAAAAAHARRASALRALVALSPNYLCVPRALVSAISELSLKDATVGAFAVAFAPAAAAAHARRASGARERYLRAIFEGVPRAPVSAISELSLKGATVGAFAVAFAHAAAAAHARRASGARERYLRAIFEGVPRALVSAISELSLKDATVGAFAVAFAPAAAAAHARRASGARERYLRAIFEGVPRALVSAISELFLEDATVGAFGVAFAAAAAATHAGRASGARERYLRAIFEGVPRALVSAISELSLKDATVGAFAVAFAPAAAAAHARRAAGARERYLLAIFEGVPRALVSAISELSLKDATVGAFAVAFATAAAAAHARRASGARERYLRAIFEGVPRALVSAISELSLKDATVGAFALAFAPAAPRALVSAISELSLKDATVGAFAVAFAPAAAAAYARRASGARERYLRAIFEGVPRAPVSAISELSLKDATVGAYAVAYAAAAAATHARRASSAPQRFSELSLKDATVGAFAVAFARPLRPRPTPGVPRALVSAISELSLKDATVGAFAVAWRPLRPPPTPGVPRALVSAISELSLKDATVGAFAVAFAPAAAAAHAGRASGARERYLRAIFEGVPRALVSAISELSLKDATVGAFAVAFAPLRPRPTPGVPRALVSAISELSLKDATVGAFAVAFAPAAAAPTPGVPRALVSAISELSLKDATVGAFAVAFAPAAAAAHARRASGARERYLRAIFEGVPRALVSAIYELSLKDATVGAFAVAFAPAAAAAHCCFNPHEAGKKAQAKFNGRCMWCSPVRLETVCKDARQSKLAARFLVILNDLDKGIFDVAAERLAAHENGSEIVDRASAILAERAEVVDQQPAVAAAAAEEDLPEPNEGDQGDVAMQLAEEETAGAMGPAEEAAAAEPPPVPAEGESAQGERPPPAPRCARRLCEGYALAQAMGRKLRAKQESGVCVFSTVKPGLRARAADGHCVFSTPERMKEAVGNPKKQSNVVSALKKFEQEKPAAENQKPEIYQKALGRLRRHLTVEEFKTIVTPKHCCRGAGADMCIFNTRLPGKPALVKKSDNSLCSWCDPGRLRTMQTSRAGGILAQLKVFHEKNPVVSAKAKEIARGVFGDDYVAKLQQKRVRAFQQKARHLRRHGDQKKQWAEALKTRHLQMAPPHEDREARKRYRAGVLADQKKIMNSFFPEEAERRPRGRADEVPKPDDVLPPLKDATHSDLSAGLRSWLERGSWGKCRTCGCLQPRPMHEIDLAGDPKVEIPQKQCRRCNAGRDYWAPCPDDVPKPLRNLSEDIVQALRPVEIDVGPETRSTDSLGRWNGYRKKVKMVTFYFSKWRVVDKIGELEGKDARSTARKAHRYLMSCDESAYRRFHDMHETFMNKHGEDAEDRKRRRPYHFLQEVGLECALWPQLYWREDMTETHEQWSDVRREENREAKDPKKKRARYGDDSEESACEDAEEDEERGGQRTSVKRSFIAKCMSDLIGYQGNFELLQFVFDLNLWATLGAKKNLNLENVPMRIRMKGHPFSPLYWKDTLNALVDLVRQVGLPKLFFTIAPWEQSFPYHEWLRDEMHKTLKTRMHLPVGETLHITHSLMQIVRGVIAGNNQQSQGRADRRWKKHVFSSKTEDGVGNKSVISFTRVEFQDGSRKEGTKRYDGSGRPHLHVLFFADEDVLADAKLEQHIFASKSDEFSDHLKGYIDGSQLDKRGKSESKWPVYNGEPGYHVQAEKLLLQHSSADKEAGLRAFCVDVMDAVPIHQDWLESDGDVARRVCFEYRPYEPEMILQLCGAQYRQVDLSTVSGGWKSVAAPYVGMQETPAWVKKYESCPWRSEEMCLLDWLRKTNDSGEIAGWLKARHQKALCEAAYEHHCGTMTPGTEPPSQTAFRTDLRKQYKQSDESAPFVEWMKEISVRAGASVADFPTLEEYARTYTVRGEKIVAVDTVFEFNDRYYGQWAAMNVPFRNLEDLQCEVVQRLVPSKYQHLATALKLCSDRQRVSEEFQDIFVDQAKFMNLMKVAGNSQKFSEAVHRMIVGQRKLIDMYLTGVLNKEDEKGGLDAEAVAMGNRRHAREDAQGDVVFLRKQLQFEEAVNDSVDRALLANHSEDWEMADQAREEAFERNKPIICLGKPGTGKTTVVKACIRRAQEGGGRVLFALPTAQLSSRMKQVLQDLEGVEIATCHAAFKLNQPITEALPLMTVYDLVVVDEVSLLDCPQFERMLKLWSVAEKVPALVFLGDKYQLPGVGETRPWESCAWDRPRCYHVKLDETWRCKEQRFQDILDELRTSKPSKDTLHKICRGRKAWKSGEPTPADLKALFEKHPDTRIVTCTRKGAATVNAAAIVALYGRKSPLATLPGDVELNPENYWDGKFRTDRQPIPSAVPVYKRMMVYLTKNVRKEDDFVNGMLCEVENYHAEEDMLRVRTKTGHRLAISRWTDREKGNAVYFPIRPGYASTIDKVQGDEFRHITIYLDGYPRPAAGYTALSRVATSDDYLIGGHVERGNFIPAF